MSERTITPVTDEKLKVTDSVVLNILTSKNIDSDFVEFKEDYNALHPYGKLYTDRKSNLEIMAVSGLPMARKTDNTLLTPGFELSGDKYYLKNNLFDGFVGQNGEIHIACVNDQPFGAIALDEGHWTPDLYIGGELVLPKSSTILETDPINSNYHDNVIEIDYGVCVRRIRVIEGRFRGSWIFPQNPNGSIRIVYNNTGKLQNRLGIYKDAEGNNHEFSVPVKDEEYLDAVLLDMASYPLEIGDSATFYPDADPESTSCDGGVSHTQDESSWATLCGGAGTAGSSSGATFNCMNIYPSYYIGGPENLWYRLGRSIFLFDTSALGAGATITSATLSLRGQSKTDPTSITPDVNIYSSAPASNTNIVAGDYDSLGATAFSSAIAYSSFLVTSTFNDFALNASGLSAISKTAVSKFGARNANYDVSGTPPTWHPDSNGSTINIYSSDQGAGYKPKLVIVGTGFATPVKLFDNSYRQRR